MRFFLLIIGMLVLAGAGPAVSAPQERGEVTFGESGLPLPRFVSISANRANLRTGPGEQYPIMWVYEKKLYPLEIVEEYEQWRKVRDLEGSEGWIHVVLLSGKRTGLITGGVRILFEEPDVTSAPVARIEAGVIGEIIECLENWCQIDVGPEEGWIRTDGLWGTYLGEIFD